jgi:hypothetical protein
LLYKALSSIYDLDVAPFSVDYTPKSSYVQEEARLITKMPLTIMSPPSYMSGGSSLMSMACSNAPKGGAKEKKTTPTQPTTDAIGLKRKPPVSSQISKRTNVMPSGNFVFGASSYIPSTRPSPSYTVVGVHKSNGGYGKALMRKPAKKPVSELTPSGKESESSGAPLRIKRFRSRPPIRRPIGQYESSNDEDTTTIASLSAKNASLWELLWELNDNLAAKIIKVRNLVDDINSLSFKLDQKLEKVARVAEVVDALAEPLQTTPTAQIK